MSDLENIRELLKLKLGNKATITKWRVGSDTVEVEISITFLLPFGPIIDRVVSLVQAQNNFFLNTSFSFRFTVHNPAREFADTIQFTIPNLGKK